MNFSDTYELNRIVAYVREGQLPLEHRVALPPFKDTKVTQHGKGMVVKEQNPKESPGH